MTEILNEGIGGTVIRVSQFGAEVIDLQSSGTSLGEYVRLKDHEALMANMGRYRAALFEIIRWDEQPTSIDLINPLHSTSVDRAIQFCANIARMAIRIPRAD